MSKAVVGVLGVLLVLSVGVNFWQMQSGTSMKAGTGDRVVAKVGNVKITENDLMEQNRDILQKQKALFQSQKRAVDGWVAQQILEMEAKSQNKTKEALINELQTQQQVDVTDEEVDAVIKQFGKVYPDPKNPNKRTLIPKDEARKYLVQLKKQDALRTYFDDLKKKYPVQTFITEPSEPKIDVDLALTNRPSFGNPNATVKLVEFSDFQCPFCARFAKETLSRIKQEYADKIFFVFRDLPIASHQYAFDAAWAAKCANRQGKFWDYHDILFENQRNLTRENLVTYAKKVGLDDNTFQVCMKDETVSKQVEEDLNQAQKLNINGTPTIVLQTVKGKKVTGELIEGAVSYDALKQKIENALGN